MKSMRLVKVILVMLISFSILLVAKESLAIEDLTSTIGGNSTSTKTTTGNSTGNNTKNNTLNSAGNNTVLKTSNTTNNNNTALPRTGLEDSVSGVILVVVLGISSVYAYKKIQYYKNI